MKKTYVELGESTAYTYPSSEVGKTKKIVISDTVTVLSGISEGIKANLKQITHIGSSVSALGNDCFRSCEKLTKAVIPSNITTISDGCFKDCTSLETLSIHDSVRAYGTEAFDNTAITQINDDNRIVVNLSVGQNAFSKSYLKHLTLSSSDVLDPEEDKNRYILDSAFADSLDLTSVSMNTVMLGSNMFNGCNKLTSISFDDTARVVYSAPSALNNCNSLTTMTFPASAVSTYYDLNTEFLKGSNVQQLCMLGMSVEEVSKAIGEQEIQKISYSEPQSTANVLLGTVYKFWAGDRTTSRDSLTQLLIDSVINHIPVIWIKCRDACSTCQRFLEYCLDTSYFLTEFKKRKCIIAYLNGQIDKKTITDMLPSKNKTFQYTDRFGQLENAQLGSARRMEMTRFIYDYTVVTPETYNEMLKNKQNTSKMNHTRYRIVINDDKYEQQRWSNGSNQWVKADFGLNFLNDRYSEDSSFPTFSYFWRRDNDEIVTPCWTTLTPEQAKAFLSNKPFQLTVKSNYTADEYATYDFCILPNDYKYSKASKYPIYYQVNDQVFRYYIGKIIQKPGFISYEPIKNDVEFAVDSSHIYLMISHHDNVIIKEGNADRILETIDHWCSAVMSCDNVIKPQQTSELSTEITYGDCWGVGHECDVYDKDGTLHKYVPNS